MEVADHLGYAYPHDLDQRVTTYVQHVKEDFCESTYPTRLRQ
jgi:hypothetical protein